VREWCGCGSSIRARRSDVLTWRSTHRFVPASEPTPGQYGGDARVETNYQQTAFTDTIGFRPNPQDADR